MIFENDKWYNILKYFSTIALPAIIAFITALSKAWGWNADTTAAIAATLAAIAVLMNSLLQVSSNKYHKMQEELAEADDQN
jgi:hypothetical protein